MVNSVVNWTGEHYVQFYENDNYLVDQVSDFIGSGLSAGNAAIVIATQAHLDAIETSLKQKSGGPAGSLFIGQENCILLNADKVLSSITVDGWPDERRFNDVIGSTLAQAQAGRNRRVHAFGEMVALLCRQGKQEAAIRLEMLWNDLAKRYSFSLLCGYPMTAFSKEEDSQPFRAICTLHSRVCPAEHDHPSWDPDANARMLAELQQKTRALESEVERRRKVEQALYDRERILTERTAALIAANEQLKSEIEKRRASEKELLHAQHVLISAQRVAHLGSWEIDMRTNELRCSDEFFRICGLEPQSKNLNLEFAMSIVHPDDQEAARNAVTATKETGQNYGIEKRIVRPDGSIRYVISQGEPIFDDRRELVVVVGAFLDITERKLAEQALSRSEERFRSLVNLSSDWYWEQDEQLRFTELSEPGLRKLVTADSSLTGFTAWELAGARCSETARAAFDADIAARRPFHDFDCSMPSTDNTRKYLQISGEPVFDEAGRFTGYRGIGKDVTGRRQAEEALRRSHDDLRRLAAHQEKIKEEERKRIAREVHDELGGLLTGLKAFVAVSMERAAKAGMPPDKLLLDASNLTDVAIESVRRIITDLRPSVLDQLGVWAALEWYADQIAERTNLTCQCMISKAAALTQLDADRSTMLFRIVQEALTNVVRHAQASAIRIGIGCQGGCVIAEIEDDGKGIDADHLLDRESWGIHGMYERVRYFGGELKITGMPGQGTIVLLRLPLETSHGQ